MQNERQYIERRQSKTIEDNGTEMFLLFYDLFFVQDHWQTRQEMVGGEQAMSTNAMPTNAATIKMQ